MALSIIHDGMRVFLAQWVSWACIHKQFGALIKIGLLQILLKIDFKISISTNNIQGGVFQ